MNRNSTLK